jgi:epoxyqueuosine reductase QueG
MMGELNRRGFLKVSAQGAAAASLAGMAGQLSLPAACSAETPQEYNSAASITSLIRDYTANAPTNSLHLETKEKAWDEPLVGFSRGNDPIYEQYKENIGPFHWTPLEAFQLAFPELSVKPDELTVISWILPATEAVKADLRKQTADPAEKWIRARIYGEEFNEELRRFVAATLTKSGHTAFAPTLSSKFKTENSPQYGMASSWSERHAAYAAGLGTFGLCDGLITPKGKAMRCGSVIARTQIPATPRPYKDHHAYCLFYAKGICGMCTKRCPAGAVTKSGHDKTACMKQCAATAQYAGKQFGLQGYGCGFCQTGVPCESRIPV